SYARAASTGSPASANSTNFTPFTTRPPATSRQGMIRRLSIRSRGRGDRLGDRERAVVERAPDHRGGDAGDGERAQIVEGGDPAGGDHLERVERAGEAGGGLEVRALAGAVAADVGVEHGAAAGGGRLARHLGGVTSGDLHPALDRHLAVAGV